MKGPAKNGRPSSRPAASKAPRSGSKATGSEVAAAQLRNGRVLGLSACMGIIGVGVIGALLIQDPAPDARGTLQAKAVAPRATTRVAVEPQPVRGAMPKPVAVAPEAKATRAAKGVVAAAPVRDDARSIAAAVAARPGSLDTVGRGEGRLIRGKDHATPAVPGERRRITPEEAQRVRADLASADPRRRLAALRFARTVLAPELEPDVRTLAAAEKEVPVKRVAAQVLALGDVAANRPDLARLRKDEDAVVRLNAAFGMARAGDEEQQAWLLLVYDASRKVAPRLTPILGAALESPEFRSHAVVARFDAIARDVRRDPALRAKASTILQAKLAGRAR